MLVSPHRRPDCAGTNVARRSGLPSRSRSFVATGAVDDVPTFSVVWSMRVASNSGDESTAKRVGVALATPTKLRVHPGRTSTVTDCGYSQQSSTGMGSSSSTSAGSSKVGYPSSCRPGKTRATRAVRNLRRIDVEVRIRRTNDLVGSQRAPVAVGVAGELDPAGEDLVGVGLADDRLADVQDGAVAPRQVLHRHGERMRHRGGDVGEAGGEAGPRAPRDGPLWRSRRCRRRARRGGGSRSPARCRGTWSRRSFASPFQLAADAVAELTDEHDVDPVAARDRRRDAQDVDGVPRTAAVVVASTPAPR